MKLTIIIPVYKVEAYLNFCLKSIARQNVEDYEVILFAGSLYLIGQIRGMLREAVR